MAPYCLTLSSYIVYDGVSNDVMLSAASGRWPAACGIVKAGGEVCCLQLPCLHDVIECCMLCVFLAAIIQKL